MAKPKVYKQPSIVSGKTVKDILDMDIATFNNLNTKEMQKVVGRLVSAGNKRIRRLQQAGLKSTPVTNLLENGGVLSTKGKDLNELRHEFLRAKSFLKDTRSTVSGEKKFREKVRKELKEKRNIELSDTQYEMFFELYDKMKELNRYFGESRMKYSTFNVILENMRMDEDVDSQIQNLKDAVEKEYKEMEEKEGKYQGVGDFFDITDT